MIERITPRDRAAWLKAREQDVTASAIGALFDCHDYMTALDLWARKTGRIADAGDETDAMRRGRLLEPVAVQIMREERPAWQIAHNAASNTYYRDPAARIGATPDVIAQDPDRGAGVVQIKSVEASTYRRKWIGEDGEPEVPLWIALQAIVEAHLTGAQWAAVMPLVVGYGIEAPIIPVDLTHAVGVIAEVKARVADFWQMIAEDREPVADYARDAALIDALHPYGDPRREVDLTTDNRVPALIAERAEAIAAKRAAEDRIAAAEAEIKAKMGDAEVAHIGEGRRITWATQRRAQAVLPPATFRVLRLPKT